MWGWEGGYGGLRKGICGCDGDYFLRALGITLFTMTSRCEGRGFFFFFLSFKAKRGGLHGVVVCSFLFLSFC